MHNTGDRVVAADSAMPSRRHVADTMPCLFVIFRRHFSSRYLLFALSLICHERQRLSVIACQKMIHAQPDADARCLPLSIFSLRCRYAMPLPHAATIHYDTSMPPLGAVITVTR
jgi:hypothetical protein